VIGPQVLGRPIAARDTLRVGPTFEDDVTGFYTGDANAAERSAALTGGTASYTAGAWVELTPSTGKDAHGFTAFPNVAINTNATDTSCIVEYALGAAGNEVSFGFQDWGHNGLSGTFFSGHPVIGWLPKGSRISARIVSAAQASETITIEADQLILGLEDLVTPATKTDTIGLNLATAAGVSLTTPSAANTWSAWTEITAATARAYRALIVQSGQGASAAASAGQDTKFQVGFGASGAEQVLLSCPIVVNSSSRHFRTSRNMLFGRTIPAGTRLVARYTSNSTAVPFAVSFVGVP
jgi:hypothetical protein